MITAKDFWRYLIDAPQNEPVLLSHANGYNERFLSVRTHANFIYVKSAFIVADHASLIVEYLEHRIQQGCNADYPLAVRIDEVHWSVATGIVNGVVIYNSPYLSLAHILSGIPIEEGKHGYCK
jgi:hypothetical protein